MLPALPVTPVHIRISSSSLPGPSPAPATAAPDLPTGLTASVSPRLHHSTHLPLSGKAARNTTLLSSIQGSLLEADSLARLFM